MYTHVCIYIYIYTNRCMYVYIYIYIYIYVCVCAGRPAGRPRLGLPNLLTSEANKEHISLSPQKKTSEENLESPHFGSKRRHPIN